MGYGYYSLVATVDTTGEVIVAGQATNSFFLFKNLGPETVYIGAVPNPEAPPTIGVGVHAGFPVEPGETQQIPSSAGDTRDLYGITAQGTANVAVLQMDLFHPGPVDYSYAAVTLVPVQRET